MNLELSTEIIDRAIEGLNETVLQQSKHFLRLSSPRDVYSIPQASFRLNCDRHDFENLFVRTGKIKLHIRNNKKYVLASEIENYLEHEKKYTSPQSTVHKPQLKQTRKAI